MFRSQRSIPSRAAAFTAAVLLSPLSAVIAHGPVAAATLPTVSVNDVSISEGTGSTKTLTFTVTQSARGKSRVTFATVGDAATAPDDFVSRTGFVRFAGKKLTKTVSVTIAGDALDEPDETFLLELTGATGATIDDGEGVGTIQDDDAPPTVQVPATLSVPEGQAGDTSTAAVDVTLSAPSGQEVTVDWATADGTATESDNDYTGDSGALSFAPGETEHVLLVPVVGDLSNEADETFTVTLSSPMNATLGNAADTITVVDNDPLPTSVPVFDVLDVKKREGASGTSTLSFTVTRGDDTTSVVTVDYALWNGTALTPSDYTVLSATGTLSFAASETSKTVDVTVVGDRQLEHNETLFLTLNNPSLGGIADGQGSGTIVNDDTKTTAVVRVRAAKHLVAVHGRVAPARPHKHAVVRLYRLRNGSWVRIATKRPVLRGNTDSNSDGFTDSRFGATMARAKHGRCKIVASYPGDKRFAGSKAQKRFRC
jgi:hypothetical protein